MSDVTQPRVARGPMLSAGVLAAALFALLAFAPFAAAAADPVASGTTTLTLNNGFTKALKKSGVKLLKISPATVKGKTVTLPVSGGSVDPLTGLGTVTQSGGIKFKEGKKTVALKNLEVNTTTASLSAKVGKKTLKVATVKGFTCARNGFGVDLNLTKLKLTGKAAKELNKALAPAPVKKKKGTKNKRASTNKAATGPFKANQVLGGAVSATQPGTVVVSGGSAALATSEATVLKLAKVGVKIATVAPTTVLDPPAPTKPTYGFPVTGGTISPTATAGVVQTGGGLQLVQDFGPTAVSKISLNAIWVDLSAKTATVEIVAESNVETSPGKKALDLGNLGRSSIADVNLTGATITSDPANHTVTVTNATATLQPVTAEVLNGFVSIYEGATKDTGKEKFAGGDPLGTFSFTAQTQ